MTPGGVLTVLNDIWFNDRRSIVECGSGVSTVYIGRLLKQRGRGQLTTLEHDSVWATRIQEAVAIEALPVGVVHAPLVAGMSGTWYDLSRESIAPETIDLLVVDGPPAYERETAQARYPALPHFASSLAPGATIILDDIGREGESAVADRWEREFGITFQRQTNLGRVAVATFRRREPPEV